MRRRICDVDESLVQQTDRVTAIAAEPVPAPEPRSRRWCVRASALAALLASTAYLVWRAAATVDLRWWYVAVQLLLLEVHAVVSLGLFTLNLWDLDAGQPPSPIRRAPGRVAVLIPTYNEPYEVLLPTVAAAVALKPAHQTWVLDDGDRSWVRDLAERLGASYLRRSDHRHAKAGNLNNALQVVDADFIAVLDADHVALPGLLRNTLGYFTNPRMALVQTPQEFYNVTSFEHVSPRAGRRYSEQELFYRGVQAGRNRWQAAFWCGTNAVLRVAALRDIGGIATGTVTEDIHTTVRLHRRGWRTVYHNEVLARGLAAADARQYLAQRLRWGTGAMQLLRSPDSPLRGRGLTVMQRVSYLTTLSGWFDSWRTLGYALIPVACVLTGAVPIAVRWQAFLAAFVPTFLLQRVALVALSRGLAPQRFATLFEFIRLPANFQATLALFGWVDSTFRVTHKGRTAERERSHAPGMLVALQWLSVVSAVWFALSVARLTPLHYANVAVADGAAFWLAVNAALLMAAVRRIRSPRYAGERRASVRFDLDAPAIVGGHTVIVRDLSLTGARIAFAGPHPPQPGAQVHVQLRWGARRVRLDAHVRSCRPARSDPMVTEVGLEFAAEQLGAQAQLALLLFQAPVPVPAQRAAEAEAETDVISPVPPTLVAQGA